MLQQQIEKIICSSKAKVSLEFYDFMEKECLSFHSNAKIPSASLIKLPIMLTALKMIFRGELRFDQELKLTKDHAVGFSRITEMNKSTFTVEELLRWMIIVSDNAATNILIDYMGMDRINEFCNHLGLNNTVLERKMMDFEAIKKGFQNWTSAADMTHLLRYLHIGYRLCNDYTQSLQDALSPPNCTRFFRGHSTNTRLLIQERFSMENTLFKESVEYSSSSDQWDALRMPAVLNPESCRFALNIMKDTRDDSCFLRYIPLPGVLAHKTGELDNLNHDCGIFFLPAKSYALTICVTDAVDNLHAQQLIGKLSKCIYDAVGGPNEKTSLD